MTIESELLSIKGERDLLLPEEIVDWARKHPDSDLHRHFEWDNKKAAEEYRLWQARRIVAIHLVYDDGERKFISLRIDRSREGGGYRDLENVREAPDLMEAALQDALDDLQRMQQRYSYLKELARVWEEVEKIRRSPRRRAKRAQPGSAPSAQPSTARQA